MTTPLLHTVTINRASITDQEYFPFSLPIIQNFQQLSLSSQITFFVGENGTGKSTLLEALAYHIGFGPEGGSKNISFRTSHETVYSGIAALAACLTLSWRQKPKDGYFFRAESFYNIANYVDILQREAGGTAYGAYGGKSLHEQSHGESFFTFFKHRMHKGGFFILDEPEAALSPARQLALLVLMYELCKHQNTQFIVATHSPLLLAYPGAAIYSCDTGTLKPIEYKETMHYQITKQFLDSPEIFIKNLFTDL